MSEFAVEAHSLRQAFGGARRVRADELLDSFGLKSATDGAFLV
jgi:hypothetical protein